MVVDHIYMASSSSSPSEVSLECKPNSYSMLLKWFADQQALQVMVSADHHHHHHHHHHHNSELSSKHLEEILARLEEERFKIDAFKRELPLCMQLLTNAVEASRQELQAYRAKQGGRPVLEEFIPLKSPNATDTAIISEYDHDHNNNINTTSEATAAAAGSSDKANWMTTAQLWSQAEATPKPDPEPPYNSPPPKEAAADMASSLRRQVDPKQRNGGGAFLPFSKDQVMRSSNRPAVASALPDLALAASSNLHPDQQPNSSNTTSSKPALPMQPNHNALLLINNTNTSSALHQPNNDNNNCNNSNNGSANQPHRKARRCWSPDLHRRFVNALQMLGGSQVATPKQIRELMKVDGLTNDEVKSHLQKYRLHTRRPSPSPQAAGGPAPQLVVLGGIWVPPEYATAAHTAGAPTLYGAHHHAAAAAAAAAGHAPPHFCASPVPQDFYAAMAASPAGPPPHQLHHHPIHMFKAQAQAQQQVHSSSPDANHRGGVGDQSESIEDGKSDSSSWKGDSADNGGDGDMKGRLAALREEGEESNGSEITLKF